MDYYVNNEWFKINTIILGDFKPLSHCKKSKKQLECEKIILKNMEDEFKKNKVKVIKPVRINNLKIKQSLWTRDSSIVIDNKCILLPSSKKTRYLEYKTIPFTKSIIPSYKNKNKNENKNDTINLEGGDIIQWYDTVFVGINERTNINGVNWLKKQFPLKKIIKIKHTTLHLDCCFSIIPNKILLYSKKYIETLPNICKTSFECINIDELINTNNDPKLGCNFLFLDKNKIMITDQHKFEPIRTLLKSYGFHLIIIKFYNLWRYGGAIRCLTQVFNRNIFN